ncbi:MAG: hypothetical protein KatS3mg012_1276 [Gaiellaceae bacterium]|nr:MAG: hypothetical protein KatS3mg012_1276 [Gaiellaceae bacterium]
MLPLARRLAILALATAPVAATAGASVGAPSAAGALEARPTTCREAQPSRRENARIERALRAQQDTWGKQLLAAPEGPTLERAERFLRPLFFARAQDGRLLTPSGVHYTHFSLPESPKGATSVALHVADGSRVISRRAHGRSLAVSVGERGREPYGSCLRRLRSSALAEGYLPILETSYVDRQGVRYEQESFAAHIPETRSLVSVVTVTADASRSQARRTEIRLTPSVVGLELDGARLRRDGRTYAVLGEGGTFEDGAVRYPVPPGGVRTVYAAWLHVPGRMPDIVLDEERVTQARESLRAFWRRKLAAGAAVEVPEPRVNDAVRNLLVQNIGLSWRYSVGNRYEQLSTPEAMDVARVLAAYGHLPVTRAILRTSLRKRPAIPPTALTRSTNWRMGARLVAFAYYWRVSGDTAEIRRATPTLRAYVRRLARQLDTSRYGILHRERFSSDVSQRVYGLHSQAVVWQGLRAMGQVWEATGNRALAAECARLERRLRAGLERAVRRSERRLPGGALFVPVRLLDDERPYALLPASRAGSYWNLVMPYALASGLFAPGGRRAEGILTYLDRHGSRLLGLVRSGAYPLYGPAKRRGTGSNPVYGLNLARFLADNDRADALVLTLYGQLAAAMTRGTFVSGESVSVTPLGGPYRTTYLPPNAASNAAFLETVRLMLVRERLDGAGRPVALELAHATPRAWLEPGKAIAVERMRTSFGRVSFRIEAGASSALVTLHIPERAPIGSLRLRLRLPDGKRVAAAILDGAPVGRVLADGETVELPPAPGTLRLELPYR